MMGLYGACQNASQTLYDVENSIDTWLGNFGSGTYNDVFEDGS